VPAKIVDIAVTEQWDENQTRGERKVDTNVRILQTSATATDAFPTAEPEMRPSGYSLKCSRQGRHNATVKYYAMGLEESSADRKRSERGCQLCKILSEEQRKCGVRGRTKHDEPKSTMNRNKNPMVKGARAPKGRRVVIVSLP